MASLRPPGNSYCESQHKTYNQIMRASLHKHEKDSNEGAAYACYAAPESKMSGRTMASGLLYLDLQFPVNSDREAKP